MPKLQPKLSSLRRVCPVNNERVFESRRFHVERRSFEHGGRMHTHDIVVHPGAAVVLPFLDDGRIVLIRNYRVAVGDALLEVPAGTLDPSELSAECAARELTEETGYRAGRVEPLLSIYSTPGIMTERMYIFTARDLITGQRSLDDGEQIELAPLLYADALAAISDGRIVDGKTIVALLYYDRFARGGKQ